MTSGRSTNAAHVLAVIGLAVLSVASLAMAWTGFMSSDDIYYYEGGRAWLERAWHVPRGFGEVRTTVTLPISLSLLLLGDSEFAAIAPTCVYMVATVLLTYWNLSRYMPASHAFVTGALLAVLPVFVLESTTPTADLAEIFWISVAYWGFVAATRDGSGNPWLLLGVGVAVGLAFTAHETVLAFILFLGVLFLLGYGIPRWRYWIMAIGFLAIIGAEATYYAIAAGEPLHRVNLLLHGFSVSTDREVVPPFTFDSAGTLRIWTPIDSLVMLFVRHDFALVYFVILPTLVALGAFALRRRRAGETLEPWSEQALLAALLGVLWFVFTAVVLVRVALLARYYLPPTYFLLIAAALMISHEIYRRRVMLIRLTLAGLFVASVAAVSVANKNPRAGERAVAAYLQANPGAVVTDPLTAFRSRWFVQWGDQDFGRVKAQPPTVGDRFLHNPPNASRPNRLLPAADVRLYAPDRNWPVVWRTQEQAPLIGRIVGSLGLASLFPGPIRAKLIDPKPEIVVYEVTTPRNAARPGSGG